MAIIEKDVSFNGTANQITVNQNGTISLASGTLAQHNITDGRKQGVVNAFVPVLTFTATGYTNNAAFSQVAAAADGSRPSFRCLSFVNGANEIFGGFTYKFPQSFKVSTVPTLKLFWQSAGTGDIVMKFWAESYADGQNYDAAYTNSPVSQTFTVGTANRIIISTVTGPLPIGGIAKGEWIYYQISRDAAAVGDTNTSSFNLFGAELIYEIDAADDTP